MKKEIYYEVEKSCCFIGHRHVVCNSRQIVALYNLVENLILNNGVRYFLFGSNSEFNTMAYKVVRKLKSKYCFICLHNYPCVNEINRIKNKNIVTQQQKMYYDCEIVYDNNYAKGKLAYIQRNKAMIDDCKYCIFWYDAGCVKIKGKSGTKTAYEYAVEKGKEIYNIFEYRVK